MRLRSVSTVLIIAVAALWAASCGGPPEAPESAAGEPVALTIFAAASLTDILTITGGAWMDATGNDIDFNFASSGALARQLLEGAPADLFISANREWIDTLVDKGVVNASEVVPFAGNRLVVIAPADSAVTLTDLAHIVDHLGEGLAIGDPSHVPAGRYAKEALEACGAWTEAQTVAIRAIDVRAALAYVQRGEAALGIVFATDARVDGVKVVYAIPDALHQPALYFAAPLKNGLSATARAFLQFMREPEQATAMSAVGFLPPGT